MTTAQEDEDMEKGGGPLHSSSLVGSKSGLVFRSNASAAAASAAITDSWHDNHSPTSNKEAEAIFSSVAINGHNSSGDDASVRHRRQSGLDDDDLDPVTLPKSTHTLFFTEPINSIPFIVSVVIAAMSIVCLLLALFNNGLLSKRNVRDVIPANVDTAVKAAQYISIFIALLMEEEIPNGLYLLRRIPRQYFMSKFPELKYEKFVCSNVLRIMMGYLFLINVLLTLIAADDVLEIFFDFIALQFLQQLDDIAFKLAQMSMLSTSMREATTRRYFKTKFVQSKLGRNRISLFFVAVYLVNLCGLLSGMVYVSLKQAKGEYQCESITVKFQEDIWEEPIVTSSKEYEETILIYSYFNGVYVQDGNSHDGRPVYTERRKFDGTEYDTTVPKTSSPYLEKLLKIKKPAKIQYCEGIKAWVFMHENIRRSSRDNSDCPWLLRSEETEVYDILEVKGPWQVWKGVIEMTDVRITCNECDDDEDCNLNGVCQKDHSCKCDEDALGGVTFMGPHCEVRLKDECRTILSEEFNDSYSVIELDWAGSRKIWQAYNRPIYRYISGSGHPDLDEKNSTFVLWYSGSRWFGVYYEQGAVMFNDELIDDEFKEYVIYGTKNYHAFWDKVATTFFVSDPTTVYTPVGVDFFWIGERGEQFGPFGAMYPAQLYNQIGRGTFRCSDKAPSMHLNNTNNTASGGRKLERSGGLIDFYRRLEKPN